MLKQSHLFLHRLWLDIMGRLNGSRLKKPGNNGSWFSTLSQNAAAQTNWNPTVWNELTRIPRELIISRNWTSFFLLQERIKCFSFDTWVIFFGKGTFGGSSLGTKLSSLSPLKLRSFKPLSFYQTMYLQLGSYCTEVSTEWRHSPRAHHAPYRSHETPTATDVMIHVD